MKTLLTTAAVGLALLATTSCRKDGSNPSVDVPQAVLTAFNNEYPAAKEVEWDTEGSNFEVEFGDNKVERSLLYAPDAKVLERSEEISVSSLPAAIPTYISSNYSGYSLEEAEKTQTAEGAVSYEVEIEKGKSEKELEFDGNGAFIGEDDEDEDDEEDDD